jgi:acyl dehydratase
VGDKAVAAICRVEAMNPQEIRTFDDFRSWEGREAGVSEWIEISQDAINTFGELSGDRQWIHTDPERAAAESPYGTTVVHGFFTLSLVSRLLRSAVRLPEAGRAINYGLNRVRFPAPVPAGAKIRGRFRLRQLQNIEGGVQMSWEVTVERQGGEKPCLVAEYLLRAYFDR